MKKEYICSRCKKQMELDKDTNMLRCKGFFCTQEISLAEYLLSPNISMSLGETKNNGGVMFLVNSKDKKFAI